MSCIPCYLHCNSCRHCSMWPSCRLYSSHTRLIGRDLSSIRCQQYMLR